jgi:hypothetical protein
MSVPIAGAAAGRRAIWSVSLAVGMATLLGLIGVVVAVRTLAAGGEGTLAAVAKSSAGSSQSIAGISPRLARLLGHEYRTSFGVVAVTDVEAINGLTAKELAGVTHGIQNLVKSGEGQIQVGFELSNTQRYPIPYNATKQFRLRLGNKGSVIPPSAGTIRSGELQPGAAIDATLAFVVPKAAKSLVLQFRDLGRAPPVSIQLGPVSAFGRISGSPKDAGVHAHH